MNPERVEKPHSTDGVDSHPELFEQVTADAQDLLKEIHAGKRTLNPIDLAQYKANHESHTQVPNHPLPKKQMTPEQAKIEASKFISGGVDPAAAEDFLIDQAA